MINRSISVHGAILRNLPGWAVDVDHPNLIERHHAALPAARGGAAVRARDGPRGAAPLVAAEPVPRRLELAAVLGVAAREGEVAALNQALGDQVPHTFRRLVR